MKKILIFLLTAGLLSACQESLEKRAERTLQDYSEKNCPMQLSESIVMDSCAFETDSHTLHYFYTFMGNMDNDSTLNTSSMRQLLLDALKNETTTRVFKEAGYSFKYTYYSQKQKGKILFETVMAKEDYQ
ncbi:MAG: hypothetical protein IJ081_07890 [Prevotella sp.]|jgi:hypothetical protein|nr:hypothetical protein [Prevotella sp.]